MKKLLLYITTFCAALIGMHALKAQEYVFQGPYATCQEKARQENKLILIDLYFVGCMPCAQMDQEVFPKPDVVGELKKDYIIYKTDVMKEMDGKKLARKYGAPGFPTFVIVNPDGKTISIESGFFSEDRFIALLQEARQLNEMKRYLAFNNTLDNDYPAAYSERFIKTREKHDFAELQAYLDQQKDLFSETAFLANSVTFFRKYNDWAYSNLAKLTSMYGGNLLRSKINLIAKTKSKQYGELQQLDSLKTMLTYIRPTFNNKLWDVFLPGFITSYYVGSQDAATYLALIDQYKLYPTWDERSNALGTVIIDQSKNPAILTALRKEYLAAGKQNQLDPVDRYRLALLHYYLRDYNKAATSINELLKSTSSTQGFDRNELMRLKEAIEKKDHTSYKAKDMKKIIPFKLS